MTYYEVDYRNAKEETAYFTENYFDYEEQVIDYAELRNAKASRVKVNKRGQLIERTVLYTPDNNVMNTYSINDALEAYFGH